jgi:type II secretory pathway pseudopilin PulG
MRNGRRRTDSGLHGPLTRPAGTLSPEGRGDGAVVQNSSRVKNSGFGTIELVVAIILFGVLVSSIGPIVKRVSTASRVNEERRVAQIELANLMEQISVLTPEQISPETIESLRTAASAGVSLPEAKLVAVVADEVDGLRQVSLSLTWIPASGNGMKPVRLSAWFRIASSSTEDAS